jgi:hypothetical protein
MEGFPIISGESYKQNMYRCILVGKGGKDHIVTVRAFFGFGAQFICGFPTMTKLKEVTPSKSYKVKQVNLSLSDFWTDEYWYE